MLSKKMKKQNKILIILAIIAVLVAAVIGIFFTQLKPVSKTDELVVFEVVEGDTLSTITNRLADETYIKNHTIANLYGRLNKISDYKVGLFELNLSWDTPRILNTLTDASAIITNEVRISFPEGTWAKDMAKLVEENTNVTSEELLALWNDPTYLNEVIERYEFIDESILIEDSPVKLEGYFFPETYNFYKETDARAVSEVLLNQSAAVYESIKNQLADSKYSYHELLTLASIVQFESATADQMGMIAGIFENRLEQGMMLQSSVTVCYALYEYDNWEECEQRTDIVSPYNTYMYLGLPPGPILNPGLAAIEAVLNPTPSDYLYFIADVCSDGEVYYAETFAEHQANVDKYLTCY